MENEKLDEALIISWVRLTGTLKNTRMTNGMIYNEAVVMLIVYNRYEETGEAVAFKDIVAETRMLKSLVNRTIDSLTDKGLLERVVGTDKRKTFVKPVLENMHTFWRVHKNSLAIAQKIRELIGDADAETFIHITEKICSGFSVDK